MDSEKWNKVKEIFTLVADLSKDERVNALKEATNGDEEILCAVERLLAAEESEQQKPLDDLSIVAHREDAKHSSAEKNKIGNYEIIRKIGTGGMGAVYLAKRGDIQQTVALKIIWRGADSDVILKRFRREQEILAALEHPNIARLLDVGVDENDGAPFLVVEYVEGTDLISYCREKKLSVDEKLKLFRKVCDAVSYAHSRLVVHRDLKPSNILVNRSGEPKLLDFGISKLITDSELAEEKGTVTSLGMLTPNYASPEQFRGETVSTATDVYSLGVILYELLTEHLPYDVTNRRVDEVARIVCETAPLRPSAVGIQSLQNSQNPKTKNQKSKTTGRFLRGDLDNILLKSLRKEPSRRYISVEQFSEDLRRHLEGLPVTARPDTFTYRAEKFVRRNYLSVSSAALLFLILIAGVIGIYTQYARAERQRILAEKRFGEVRQLANNVVFKYQEAIAQLAGATKAREMMIKDALVYLDGLSQDAGENDAALQDEIALAYKRIGDVQGRIYVGNLGDAQGALENYGKSAAIFEKLMRENPDDAKIQSDAWSVVRQISNAQMRRENWTEAAAAANREFEIAESLTKRDPQNNDYQDYLGIAYLAKGHTASFTDGYPGRIENYRKALAILEDVLPKDPKNERLRIDKLSALQPLGTYLEFWSEALREQNAPAEEIQSKVSEAVEVHRRGLALAEEMAKDFPENANYHRNLGSMYLNYGSALARAGNAKESLECTRRSLAIMQEGSAADPNNREFRHDVAQAFQYVGMSFERGNDAANAIENYNKSLETFEELTAADATNIEFIKQQNFLYNAVGDLYMQTGRAAEALKAYQNGINFVEEFSAKNASPQMSVLHSNSLARLGKFYEISRAADWQTARNYFRLAEDDLLALKDKNLLSKTDEYKIDLTADEVRRCDEKISAL